MEHTDTASKSTSHRLKKVVSKNGREELDREVHVGVCLEAGDSKEQIRIRCPQAPYRVTQFYRRHLRLRR